jgi:hypothetical protein
VSRGEQRGNGPSIKTARTRSIAQRVGISQLQGSTDFIRIILALLIVATASIAVLAMQIAFMRPAFSGPIERVSAVLRLVLIELIIGFGTYYAFGRAMAQWLATKMRRSRATARIAKVQWSRIP